MTLHVSTTARNAGLDAIFDRVDLGFTEGLIHLLSEPRPESADVAPFDQVILASFTLYDPAFLSAVDGTKELNLPSGPLLTTALDDGEPTWALVCDSEGTVVFTGTVGTSGTDFIINLSTLSLGQEVALLMGTITDPPSPA